MRDPSTRTGLVLIERAPGHATCALDNSIAPKRETTLSHDHGAACRGDDAA